MRGYMKERFHWPGVQWCGWIFRYRLHLSSGESQSRLTLWVAGAAFPWELSARQAAAYLRRHWEIENGVFYVREVTLNEDRLPGRKIGYALSGIRNAAINLLRSLDPLFIPDAQRYLAARSDFGLPLLIY